ncbi:hypothetical protein SAMN05216388_10553 [Halorientalis persicus]|uniref:Uncharacterized protein n=1 Tax=Halorientalis persicus TaxID=1367881 RepID=A0A1H8WCB7_9EURY|nr:hypothetical protein [Halorientalis persicus]SEP25305.1 hypothetical protein SAMN05216388_10553 [Halorientalis persicus]
MSPTDTAPLRDGTDDKPSRLPDLPDDDTKPDKHGNLPKPCLHCRRDPAIGDPVQTTNRSLDAVDDRVQIEPVCDGHDRDSAHWLVWRCLAYGNVAFLADALTRGVVSQSAAFDAIDAGPDDAYPFVPADAEHDPEATRADLLTTLEDNGLIP